MNKIIDGKQMQNEIKEELINKINQIPKKLKLVVIQVGDNPASNVYVKNKGKLCLEVGILFSHIKYDDISEKDLISKINELNKDTSVTGILVQLPLPKHINEEKILEAISPLKDVDGLTSKNIGNLFSQKEGLVPCTALGVMEILNRINVDLTGKKVVILGRSKLVGLPLIALMLKENATVTTCHSKTKNLKEITKNADILVVAIGKKEYITKEYITKDTIIIDVGITRENNKLYGDCNYNDVLEDVSYITKVPGGVGPLTVIMLINNIIKAYEMQK